MQQIETEQISEGLRTLVKETTVGFEGPGLANLFARKRARAFRQAKGGTVRVTETRRIRRNDPCPCGSGVKFKKCCGRNLKATDERIGT